MPELIVNSKFADTLSKLRNNTGHAIIVHGVEGVGLKTIAISIAGKNHILIQPLTKKGQYDASTGIISVDRIRELYAQTRTDADQYIIIDDADRMTPPAQNSLLKLLEEPTEGTRFILTTHHPDALLPTIRSRANSYHVPAVSMNESQSIIRQFKLNDTEMRQLLFLAGGLPAKLINMGQDPNKLSDYAEYMKIARTFLSDSSRYERLKAAMRMSSSRTQSLELIDSALLIIKHTMYGEKGSDSSDIATRLLQAREAISNNANQRLQLVHFVLQ